MKLNFNISKPIYEQIIEGIKKMIARGELKPGEKLPSQREMAVQVEVNPNTIQRAYREMEVLNLVVTKRGRGTFVREDIGMVNNIKKEMAQNAANKFIHEMVSLGFSISEMVEWFKGELDHYQENDIL